MYFRVNLKMKKPTICCCFTWIVFIEHNFTVAFLLIKKYGNNHAKTSVSSWQYHKDDLNDNIIDSELFNFTTRITGTTPAAGNKKDVETAMQLKHLSSFWRTLEMPG